MPSRLLRSIRLFVDASRTRSVAETSTGNANVIYLGLLLERLVARMAADDVVDSVLAVEEPEAHLHPVLQRQLFRYLLGSGTALVVTTHSPHIAAVAPLPSLVLLRSGAEGGTVAATTARAQLSDGQRADLERYLDVSRAELLFCTAAILVEGPSEVYLVPALARALDFDLDAHGVIVANVAGTDFAPYRILLGAMALDVPQVIITDGDPVRDGKHVYAGIARAVNLCPAGPAKDALANQLSALIEAGAGADVASARVGAMAADVFVGVQTLEIDIAALLADQMTKAHAEIETSQNLIGSFDQAVRSVAQSGSNDDQRREVLRRVEYVSKGRFAQRLAAHVDGIDPAGLTVVIQGQLLVKPEPSSSCAETMAGLMGAGSYGYLLAAMDRVSWQVRGHGLLPAPAAPTVSADA